MKYMGWTNTYRIWPSHRRPRRKSPAKLKARRRISPASVRIRQARHQRLIRQCAAEMSRNVWNLMNKRIFDILARR